MERAKYFTDRCGKTEGTGIHPVLASMITSRADYAVLEPDELTLWGRGGTAGRLTGILYPGTHGNSWQKRWKYCRSGRGRHSRLLKMRTVRRSCSYRQGQTFHEDCVSAASGMLALYL